MKSEEKTIKQYNTEQEKDDKKICTTLKKLINENLPEATSKVWHRHPVWFIDGNPIVGYSKLKSAVRLMFWSGVSFEEDALKPGSGKFKDASIDYREFTEINLKDIKRWLQKSKKIQWDYKNIVKRKGKLLRIK